MAGPDSRLPADGSRAAEAEAGGFLSRWSRRKALVRQGEVPAEPLHVKELSADLANSAALTPLRGTERLADSAPTALAPADSQQSNPPAPPLPPPQPAAPTLADVDLLNRESDYGRFVQPGVDAGVRNAALKKLFSDPHFNLMDRLDTYIDDYSLPDPLPAGMLRQMVQSHALGLFDEVPEEAAELDAPDPPGASHPPGTAPSAAAVSAPVPVPVPVPVPATDSAPEPIPEPIQATDEDPDLRLQPHPAAGPAGPGQGLVPDPGRER